MKRLLHLYLKDWLLVYAEITPMLGRQLSAPRVSQVPCSNPASRRWIEEDKSRREEILRRAYPWQCIRDAKSPPYQ